MPARTCVGCREEADREDLVRLVVLPDGTVGVDPKGSLPGRGAWIHPRASCVSAADRGIGRALGVGVARDVLHGLLRAAVERAIGDGISLAAAAGALVGGHDALERALKAGEVDEVVVARDASARTVASLRDAAQSDMAFTTVPIDAETLGRRVGRGARAALGVRPSRAASHLRRQLRRLRDLG